MGEALEKNKFTIVISAVAALFLAVCVMFVVPQFAGAEGDENSYPPSKHSTIVLDDGMKFAYASTEPGKAWVSADGNAWQFVQAAALVQTYDENQTEHYAYFENFDDALDAVLSDATATILLFGNVESAYDFTKVAGAFDEDGIFMNPFFVKTNGYEINFEKATVPEGLSVVKGCETDGLAVYTLSAQVTK